MLSSRAPIGYLAIAGRELCTNQGFKSIVCNKSLVNNEYLYYWLSTKVEYLQSISNGATFKELSKDTLENVLIDLPDLDEQQHIVNTIGSVDDLIEKYQLEVNKICELLKLSLKQYDQLIEIEYYHPKIIKSGIDVFENSKEYIDTSSIEGINNLFSFEPVTFEKRPSRANMQPIQNSVWFAKMKESKKKLILTDEDIDIINRKILSTGFQGIEATAEFPLSLIAAIVISDDFDVQRDINSVGTTMAGINNETFLKIKVPLLSKDEIKNYDEKYSSLVKLLSLRRKQIDKLKTSKQQLLLKYF